MADIVIGVDLDLAAGPGYSFQPTATLLREKDAMRNTINHFVHHRGQLTVYLRELDVPIPQLYGPTADEK